MLFAVARFELRYQLRNPVFWVVGVLFFLLAFSMIAVSQIAGATGGTMHVNAPVKIAQLIGVFSAFVMFASAAFVANVVLRDDETGYGPIIRSTRIGKVAYLIGRFSGAVVATALLFLLVPLGLWVATLMPWIDPETLGPNRWSGFVYGYLLFGLPNIVLLSAILFTLATVTRSMMATYIGVVAILVVNGFIGRTLAGMPQYDTLRAYASPFGNTAFGLATRYWTSSQSNAGVPALDSLVLGNRLLWLGLGVACLALACWRFRFEVRGSKRARRAQALQARIAALPLPPATGRLPDPDPGRAAAVAIFHLRTGFELLQILRSPAFPILLAIGLMTGLLSLTNTDEMYGTALLPVTRIVVQTLSGSFSVVALAIAIFYAGELVWRERDRHIHEIVDATPMPDWAYVVPKALALSLVLLAVLLFATLSGMLFQAAKGYGEFEPLKYLLWFVLPMTVDWLLLGILALFVQALSPNKYVGWGVMLLYFVSTILFDSLGWTSSLYNYGMTPKVPLSDMNGMGGFWVGSWWLRLYWGACAVMMLVVAHLLWRRGTETRFAPRLARLPARLRSPAGALFAAALALFIASGMWAYVNMHVRNVYRSAVDIDRMMADREHALLRYEHVPQPTITAVTLRIDLHPGRTAMTAQGRYALENRTGRPLSAVHVQLADPDTTLVRLTLPGATLVRDWPDYGYRIYRLATPLAPGARTTMTFATRRGASGFRDRDLETRLVHNGTFLQSPQFAPTFGMTRSGLLVDRAKRRKYGLPVDMRMPKLDDRAAQAANYVHADWVRSDITLVTDAGQTPIAPGDRVSDITADGRRTARFVSAAPMLNIWSIQSARYAERHLPAAGRDLVVFHDARHARNVGRMLAAMRASLDHYGAAYGPYPQRYARIVEFPDYSRFAQAFAGTMPYSEGIGFIADLSDPAKIDYVTYVVAHEMAHQWWAHQVIGAHMQGSTMLSETLAQYSALMVMERLYGPDRIRRFLQYELDAYLQGRGNDPIGEQPLVRVENQQYIHYRKGALAMYLLKDRLGQPRVDAALARFLARYRFRGPPYPRSLDLIAEFRRGATPAEQALITDLFERITLHDLKAVAPPVRRRPDGRYDVTVGIQATKLYADARGNETPAAMIREPVDIGLFAAVPGRGDFSAKDVILMRRVPVSSGKTVLHFVTDKAPAYVGIDPYNKIIDRNSDDNIAKVPAR